MVIDGLFDGAAWFVGMGTVCEAALAHTVAHLWEALCEGLFFHVVEGELADPRGVNDPGTEGQRMHFGESRGMFPFVIDVGFRRCER